MIDAGQQPITDIDINAIYYLVHVQKGFYELDTENVLDVIVGDQAPPRLANAQRKTCRDTERFPLRDGHLGGRPGHGAILDREREVISDAEYTARQDTCDGEVRIRRSVDGLDLKVPRGRGGRFRQPDGRFAVLDPPTDPRASCPYAVCHPSIGRGEGKRECDDRWEVVHETGKEGRFDRGHEFGSGSPGPLPAYRDMHMRAVSAFFSMRIRTGIRE